MSWFNYYGLIAVVAILLPNIIVAIVDKSSFENKFDNKAILVVEQIGRYCSMAFMVFNIPFTYFDFWFENAFAVYLIVGSCLLLFYYLGWIIFRKNSCTAKMIWLSVTPTVLFLFCGIMLVSIPLIISAVLFGVGHITVSYNNRSEVK
ncbi:MAG: hypothetical protein J1F68_03395 [Clostridiales bacterium]|nr:hypothetical protein [Clostridiales bacterium]